MYVANAKRYIEVRCSYVAGAITIAGKLNPDEELRGESFDIRIALQTEDGRTGEYYTWHLGILDLEPVSGGSISDGDYDLDTEPEIEPELQCVCNEVNTCCDGCSAINEGGSCDDGNPNTWNSCASGVCTVGGQVRTLEGHSDVVRSVSFSPDGTLKCELG